MEPRNIYEINKRESLAEMCIHIDHISSMVESFFSKLCESQPNPKLLENSLHIGIDALNAFIPPIERYLHAPLDAPICNNVWTSARRHTLFICPATSIYIQHTRTVAYIRAYNTCTHTKNEYVQISELMNISVCFNWFSSKFNWAIYYTADISRVKQFLF